MAIPLGVIGVIAVILAIIGSILGWINTKIILEDLETIKKHLGIKEDKGESFVEANNKE